MSRNVQDELIELARAHLLRNYRQQPLVFERGVGVRLFDKLGNEYLDMTAGVAVCALGHAHPALVKALAEQAQKLVHVSNLYYNEPQIRLAHALARRSFADRVFFCNSGAEANEAALKLARRYQHVVAQAPERVTMVAAEGSFHGRTVGTVSLTGQEKYRKGFGTLWEPVRFVPYGDLAALAKLLGTGTVCAVILEPVQGDGGLFVPPPGYLKAVRAACDEAGALLIFDEVQTGMGRTGTWFAYEQEDVTPHIMTLAKGLGGGVPIGAMLTTDAIGEGLAPLEGEPAPHASTFGGNPLCCAAALAVLDVFEKDNLIANCRARGEELAAALTTLVAKHPRIAVEVRGRGLLRGLRVARDASRIMAECRARGLLVTVAGGDVIRFAPPLIIGAEEIAEAVRRLDVVLAELGG